MVYHPNSKATAVSFDGERIRSATVKQSGRNITVTGDYFIFALPAEDVIDLITPDMMKADPVLASLFTLDDITEWMNGIQITSRKMCRSLTATISTWIRRGRSRRFPRRTSGTRT